MQPMPILMPLSTKSFLGSNPFRPAQNFVIQTSCRGEATRTPWPFPHETFNSECIPQTFFIACRITPSASARRQKMTISSVRAINEQIIHRTSLTSGQRTLEKWRSMRSVATTHLSSSKKLPIQSLKYSSHTRYMIMQLYISI